MNRFLAIPALFLASAAADSRADRPSSGLRGDSVVDTIRSKQETSEVKDDESHALQVEACQCSCSNPYGREDFEAAETGVLIQIIPIPGSPVEHTQVCLAQSTATPAMIAFPFAVWCVPEPCPN